MKEASTIIYYQYKPKTWLALLFSTKFLVVGDEVNWPEEPCVSHPPQNTSDKFLQMQVYTEPRQHMWHST